MANKTSKPWALTELLLYMAFVAALGKGIIYLANTKNSVASDIVYELSVTAIAGLILTAMFLYRWKTGWPSPAVWVAIVVGFLTLTVSVFSIGVLTNWYLGIQLFWLVPLSWFLFFGFVLWYGMDITIKIEKEKERMA